MRDSRGRVAKTCAAEARPGRDESGRLVPILSRSEGSRVIASADEQNPIVVQHRRRVLAPRLGQAPGVGDRVGRRIENRKRSRTVGAVVPARQEHGAVLPDDGAVFRTRAPNSCERGHVPRCGVEQLGIVQDAARTLSASQPHAPIVQANSGVPPSRRRQGANRVRGRRGGIENLHSGDEAAVVLTSGDEQASVGECRNGVAPAGCDRVRWRSRCRDGTGHLAPYTTRERIDEVQPFRLAVIHAALGHHDQALDALARAADIVPHRVVGLLREPEMAALHDHPRVVAQRRRFAVP